MSLRLQTAIWASTISVLLAACADSDDGDRGPSGSVSLDASSGSDANQSSGDGGVGTDGGTDTGDGGDGGGGLDVPERTWTWVEVEGTKCMSDDNPTGIGVNPVSNANRAIIFLQGGNACYNPPSCAITANPGGFGQSEFQNELALIGTALNRQPANPFANDTFVYIPYCTGDVHAGTREGAEVFGEGPYNFVGFENLRLMLDVIIPSLDGVEEIVLAGISAGGFGAAINFDYVQRRFGPEVRVTLIDDSGPPFGNEFLAPCLQNHFRTTWGLDEGPLENCTVCSTHPDGAFVEDYFQDILARYPDNNFGILSSEGDAVIRGFWSFGENDCAALDGSMTASYSEEKFLEGLEDLRDRIMGGTDNGKVFLLEGNAHVLLLLSPLASIRDGVLLISWIQQAIADSPNWADVPSQ